MGSRTSPFLTSSLKELDSKALKLLSSKVNVIPLIAKADTMTVEEKKSFKSILLRDLDHHNIKTFPSSYPDEVDGADELLVKHPLCVGRRESPLCV
jgi:septin family protein